MSANSPSRPISHYDLTSAFDAKRKWAGQQSSLPRSKIPSSDLGCLLLCKPASKTIPPVAKACCNQVEALVLTLGDGNEAARFHDARRECDGGVAVWGRRTGSGPHLSPRYPMAVSGTVSRPKVQPLGRMRCDRTVSIDGKTSTSGLTAPGRSISARFGTTRAEFVEEHVDADVPAGGDMGIRRFRTEKQHHQFRSSGVTDERAGPGAYPVLARPTGSTTGVSILSPSPRWQAAGHPDRSAART